jgi:hypothetical protein
VALFLIFMLVFFGAAIYGVTRLMRAGAGVAKKHFDETSAALLPLISGTASPNQQLTGTYSGMKVVAYMHVESERDADSTPTNKYYFFNDMVAGPGRGDWTLDYTGDGLLHTGSPSWHLKTKDDALKSALTAAGALDAAGRIGGAKPAIAYRAKDGVLSARSPGSYKKVWPDAATFANQLEVLAALADCNKRANASS